MVEGLLLECFVFLSYEHFMGIRWWVDDCQYAVFIFL